MEETNRPRVLGRRFRGRSRKGPGGWYYKGYSNPVRGQHTIVATQQV